jgi:NIMA (never in mitosis gene a)-related kinase
MVDSYEPLEEVGKGKPLTITLLGSFGKVFKIKRKSDNKILVWKELAYGKMSEREKQQLVSEVNIL